MILAINTSHSKTVTISFTLLKASIFAFISYCNVASMPNTKCSIAVQSYFQLMKALLPLCILVDLLSLAYFFFSVQFQKIYYYVYYLFHWIITLISLMGGFYNLVNNPYCQQSYSFVVSIISICIVYQINTLIAMIQDLNIVLKYIHFGSNLVWLVLWYSTSINKCTQPYQTIIAFIHAGLCIVNSANFLFSKLLGRSCNTFGNGKMLIAFSLFLMLFCYLLILLQGYIPEKYTSSRLFHKNYMAYGMVELISPLLLLIFLQQEVDDPQQILNKMQQKFVQDGYQHADCFVQN